MKKPNLLVVPYYTIIRGGSRGTSNNCVGEEKSKYLLRKTKLLLKFLLSYTGVRRTLVSFFFFLLLGVKVSSQKTLTQIYSELSIWNFQEA